MLRAIKVRLYPNDEQKIYLGKLFGCYRKIYNMSLEYKKDMYEKEQKCVGLMELGKKFHKEWSKSKDMKYLGEHNTKVLKQAILNLMVAYKNFFERPEVGYPKFKCKHDNQSVRFPIEAISKKNDYSSGRLTLVKGLSAIKFKTSDEYVRYLVKNKENIRSATLSKNKSGHYHLSILVDGDLMKAEYKKPNKLICGVDLGIKDFVITSNGDKFDNIKSIRSNEKMLIKSHKSLSKKKPGSKNREKARIKLAKKHEKIKNKKDNYLHSVCNKLLDENKIIVLESLNVKGMMKNHKLAKAIQELSLSKFKTMLQYKAKWRGNLVLSVNRFFPSSKLCNICDYKNDNLTLKDRYWTCPICGTLHDRDYNATFNIKKEGIKMIMDDETLYYFVLNTIKDENLEINDPLLLEYLENKVPTRSGDVKPLEILS